MSNKSKSAPAVDKTATSNATATPAAPFNAETEAYALRKRYDGFYKRSHQTLYEILADCFKFYNKLINDEAEMEKFKKLCEDQKISFNKKKLLNAIMYFICDTTDRKHACSLATVVRKGIEAGETPETLVQWIYDQGGKDKITRSGKKSSKASQSPSNHKDIAVAALNNVTDKISSITADTKLDVGQYAIGILRVTEAGTFELVQINQSEDVINTALSAVGKEMSVEQTNSTETKLQDEAQAIADTEVKTDADKSAA